MVARFSFIVLLFVPRQLDQEKVQVTLSFIVRRSHRKRLTKRRMAGNVFFFSFLKNINFAPGYWLHLCSAISKLLRDPNHFKQQNINFVNVSNNNFFFVFFCVFHIQINKSAQQDLLQFTAKLGELTALYLDTVSLLIILFSYFISCQQPFVCQGLERRFLSEVNSNFSKLNN